VTAGKLNIWAMTDTAQTVTTTVSKLLLLNTDPHYSPVKQFDKIPSA